MFEMLQSPLSSIYLYLDCTLPTQSSLYLYLDYQLLHHLVLLEVTAGQKHPE